MSVSEYSNEHNISQLYYIVTGWYYAPMTEAEFEAIVQGAVDQIPEKFRALMTNVAITIEEEARPEQGKEIGIRHGDVLLGLYEGVPHTRRGVNYSLVPPDKITIFQRPIEQLGQTTEGIRELVADTVWHEIGHHFGLSDEQIHAAEKRRKKNHHV